jgi:hypothetical protein
VTGSFSDRDRGYKKLLKRLSKAKPTDVTVGIHETEGSAPHDDDGEATIADVGMFHEFGLGVPQRSFIREWADENENAHKAMLRKMGAAVIAGKIDSEEQALERFGVRAVGEVQARIKSGIEPALDPETIARKGSSTPLISTGLLWTSISHKVNK